MAVYVEGGPNHEQVEILIKLWNSFHLTHGEYVWIDGFCNYLVYNRDDNPYLEGEEPVYSDYKSGTEAAKSFLKSLGVG